MRLNVQQVWRIVTSALVAVTATVAECTAQTAPRATAAGWSAREPSFFPEWVEKVDMRLAN